MNGRTQYPGGVNTRFINPQPYPETDMGSGIIRMQQGGLPPNILARLQALQGGQPGQPGAVGAQTIGINPPPTQQATFGQPQMGDQWGNRFQPTLNPADRYRGMALRGGFRGRGY